MHPVVRRSASRAPGLAVTLIIACTAASAAAQPAPPEPSAPPAATPSCPAVSQPPASAVSSIARTVAAGLGPLPAGSLVVSGTLRSAAPAKRSGELLLLLARQIAGRLGPTIKHHKRPLDLAGARQLTTRKTPALVYLRPALSGGNLAVTADVYPVPRTIWARVRAPEPGPVAHAYAAAPLDAEVRSFLPALGFAEPPAVTKHTGADPHPVALGCGDLDGDGAPDLVTVSRERILTVRLREGQVRRLQEARWADLQPVAPAPLQQPIGLATIVVPPPWTGRSGYLDVGLSDRAASVRLSSELELLGSFRGLAVPAGAATACTRIHNLLLDHTLFTCALPGEGAPPLSELGHQSDALASTVVVGPDGELRGLTALRVKSALYLRWHDGSGRAALELGAVGAQLALGDVDQDGAPEIVTSLDVLSPQHDAVVVRSILGPAKIAERYRLPVPKGVDALAVCPADGLGRAPIVVAAGDELWVIR